MLLAGMAGFIENLVCFAGGQPLVPQVDGKPGQRAQFGGKGLGSGCLGAQVSGEMQGIAHHDARYAKAPAEPRQRAQVLAPVVPPLQHQHRLRRQTQLVRDGYADAAVADVETEIANSFQLPAPSF